MAKKNVIETLNLTNENGNTAKVEVLINGDVDVTIYTTKNITLLRHFNNIDIMAENMRSLGYKAENMR